jgi:hypothetical protein
VDAKLAPVNVEPYNLYANRSLEDEQLLVRPLPRIQKYEYGGQFRVKIHILFYGCNS